LALFTIGLLLPVVKRLVYKKSLPG
jgi:hypothetical protein